LGGAASDAWFSKRKEELAIIRPVNTRKVFWAARKDINRGEIPDYLYGRWISSAPAYQDRYLEINNVSLIFATSPTTVAEYFITKITTTDTGKEILFTFDCKDLQDNTYQFFLTYQPDNGGTLFLETSRILNG
jgi:hypothetical protein